MLWKIKTDNSGDELIPSHNVWCYNVHGCFAGLFFHPLQQSRQAPVYDVGKVVTHAKDIQQYPGILRQRQVQATNVETCRIQKNKCVAVCRVFFK